LVDPKGRLNYTGGNRKERIDMRAEIEKNVAEIEQVLNLLRRHL
jgi:hypothetical protein